MLARDAALHIASFSTEPFDKMSHYDNPLTLPRERVELVNKALQHVLFRLLENIGMAGHAPASVAQPLNLDSVQPDLKHHLPQANDSDT